MDQFEEYFEEVSEDEVEVGQQEEVLGVVAPMPIGFPSEVQVSPPADNPKSPSPSPPTPSPEVPSSPQGCPVGDAVAFMGPYTHEDVADIEQWTVDARAARAKPAIRIEEPDVSPSLKTFLRYTLGAQWEVKLVRESGEVLIEQLCAYLAG